MGCRRMLGVEDRAAIMAGLEAGLSQVCIAHLIGRSPSVVCREIARHAGPDGACSIVCVSVFCLKGLMHDE